MEEEVTEEIQGKKKLFTISTLVFAILFIAILIAAIYLRTPLLKYYGFYEPDGFFHYAVIQEALANGWIVPKNLSLSGTPYHPPLTEPAGLYYVTLVPYALLQYFGVSVYNVMRNIPILFGLLDTIGAFFLVRFISKDKFLGILTLALVGLSSADTARTSGTIYRGDGFVAIFLIIALILILQMFRTKGWNRKVFGLNLSGKKLLFAAVSGLSLSVCNLVWSGAAFATIVYMLSFLLIAGLAFVLSRDDLFNDSAYMLVGLLVWLIFIAIYTSAGLISYEVFTGTSTLFIWIGLAVAWLIAFFISIRSRESPMMRSAMVRSMAIALLSLVLTVAGVAALIGGGHDTFSTAGAPAGAFLTTIQELQPPTFAFLYVSFADILFTTPMGVMLALFSLYQTYILLFFAIGFILLIPYLFMQVIGAGEWLHGRAIFNFELKPEMLVLIAYFAITAYLEIAAVRFNSLASVPLAIFSAFTMYWLIIYAKRGPRINGVTIMDKLGVIIVIILLVWLISEDIPYTQTIVQADNLNPQFFAAVAWLHNNTATNATVLTLWPDGSVVEGLGGRTSVTDSVASQNATNAQFFARWLFNATPDPGFLGTVPGGERPDYLLTRSTWLLETSGIFTEGNFSSSVNPQLYVYDTLPYIQETVNQTAQEYKFSNPAHGETADVDVVHGVNGSAISGYLVLQSGVSPFGYIAFYDVDNGNYSIVQQTYNTTNGYMLLVQYSEVPSTHLPINVTSVYIFGPGLANSNLLRMLYFCNDYTCALDANGTSYTPVYANSDTRIYRITYSNSP